MCGCRRRSTVVACAITLTPVRVGHAAKNSVINPISHSETEPLMNLLDDLFFLYYPTQYLLSCRLSLQVMQLSEQGGSSAIVEELKRENENLVDMIRQLSTTGTLDAATVQRLKDEIAQNAVADHHDLDQQLLNQSSSSEAGELGNIDWHSAFNDLQIEVEYLRSQNAALLNRLQEAGLVWDEEGGDAYEDGDRTEMLRLQLDNAIRNVHEREMRCQELTWEITKVFIALPNCLFVIHAKRIFVSLEFLQLLEERDTLQLRLSNSLRQNHEMQQELKDFAATANSSESDIAAK